MDITIICDSVNHPVIPYIIEWISLSENNIKYVNSVNELTSGDFLFLISCNQIIYKEERDKYRFTLVLHASKLPEGRGWNPHIWKILEGGNEVTLSLLEANDKVDTGKIWHQILVKFDSLDLVGDINDKLFKSQFRMLDWALENYSDVKPVEQVGESNYYRLRTPQDSEIDITKSIEDQFSLLRVCDQNRFPAFFYYCGGKFNISISRVKNCD